MNTSEYNFMTELSYIDIVDIIASKKGKFLANGIVGKCYRNRIEIRYKSTYANSWSPIFFGVVEVCSSGSLISGSFKISTSTRIFMRLWRCFSIFMLIILAVAMIYNRVIISMIPFVAVPLFVYIFSFAMDKIGINAGERDKEDILCFITRELQATITINESTDI